MANPDSPHSQPVEALASGPQHQLFVDLQVISPSVCVDRPLLFPDLPATTTIRLLKDLIRQTLPLRPSDESQRLIHRGRALLRESESLLDIFGAEALRTLNRQTIHLVIRDADSLPSTLPTGSVGANPELSGNSANTSRALNAEPSLPWRSRTQATAPQTVSQTRMASPAPVHPNTEQVAAFQQHHQNMAHRLAQAQREAMLHREATVRALVSQNQRARAQLAMHGIGDAGVSSSSATSEANIVGVGSGNIQYIPCVTVGPNGQNYHIETVWRTASPGNTTGLSAADVQNIIRNADAHHAALTMTSALQRSALGPLHNRPLTQPGVTTPLPGAGASLTRSGRATPNLETRVAAHGSLPTTPGAQVYLLSSPEGPRALLFNISAAETYFSPIIVMHPRLRSTVSQSNLTQAAAHQHAYAVPLQQRQQAPHIQTQHEADVPPEPANDRVQPVHPNNPAVAGLPPLLMQLWPHLWLIFRLSLFVWFFTSPNSSWSRWLTIIVLAVFMFVLSTGLLNNVAENAWRPIGRHLENVLPALELPRVQDAGQAGNMELEQARARLMAERRDPAGWLAVQLRLLERAGLLFLASLAPGIAERHIANLEAEARVEGNRRRESETATEAPAARDADGEAGEETEAAAAMATTTRTEHDDDRNSDSLESSRQEQQRSEDGCHEANTAHEPNREEILAL